LVFIFSYFIFV